MVDMHNTIVQSFGKALQSLGWTLELAGHSFNHHKSFRVGYGRKWSQEEIDREIGIKAVKSVEVDDLFNNPPDIYMIMCAEQQADQLNIWINGGLCLSRTKLVFYSGNDSTGMFYNPNYCRNLLAADISSYATFKAQGKHTIYYFPWVDYDTFQFKGTCNEPVIRSYINEYQKLFPQAYELAQQCTAMHPQVKWEPVQGLSKQATIELMHTSMATLHSKNLEGYGFAIVESLACGRPVILYRPWSASRSYVHWCLEGQSALYFETPAEYMEKTNRLFNDTEYRHKLQTSAAETVRKIINNEEQSAALKKFLEESM